MRLCQTLLKLPLAPLLVVGLLLGLSPFSPEPHLLEKLRLLLSNQLRRPIDIFDLTLHGLPVLLLILRLTAAAICRERPNG